MTPGTRSGQAPLAGVRVVALEQAVAAPLCTRHLCDLGAEVIKVERPGAGDFARHYDPYVNGQSTHFVWLNRGKKSIELDLAGDRGGRIMHALLARADVFVHNLGPGAVDRLGFGWAALHPRCPALVVCSISGFGPGGPDSDRKAFDAILQGESGVMAVTGTRELPVKVGVSIADLSAGMYALSAILAALYQRRESGQGEHIEIALLDCLAEWMMPFVYQYAYTGSVPARSGAHHAMIAPYGPYETKDGSTVNVGVQNAGQWTRFANGVIQRPDLAGDPRFATNESRVRNRAALDAELTREIGSITSAALVDRLARHDVPYGRLNSVAGLRAHPQLAARGRWLQAQSESGPVLALAHPFTAADAQTAGAVPSLGEHTDEILRELGLE